MSFINTATIGEGYEGLARRMSFPKVIRYT